MQVDISSEGSNTLRCFAEVIRSASTSLAESFAVLEASFSFVAESLGPQMEHYRAMIDVCRKCTMNIVVTSETMAIGLKETADSIDDYLSENSTAEEILTLISSTDDPETNLFYDLYTSAQFTKEHSTTALFNSFPYPDTICGGPEQIRTPA